jgi:hypothetical protein
MVGFATAGARGRPHADTSGPPVAVPRRLSTCSRWRFCTSTSVVYCHAGVLLPGFSALAVVSGLAAWRVAVYGRREYIVANMMRKYVPKGGSAGHYI